MSKYIKYNIHKAINFKSHRKEHVNSDSLIFYMRLHKNKSYTIDFQDLIVSRNPRLQHPFDDGKTHSKYKQL